VPVNRASEVEPGAGRSKPYRWRLFLLFLILLAFALRVYQLDNFGFWTDEGLTPLRAGYPVREILSNRIIIQEGVTQDTHPPLYFLIIHFSQMLLGRSDFAYRYPSVLFGLLLVPLLFQLGRRLNGVTVGFLAALLAAVNPLQIWYAQEARMYTLLALLGAVTTYILWRALTATSLSNQALAGRLLLYLLFAGLAIYTQYTAVFLVGIQLLFWAWLLWQRGERRLILATAVAGLFIALPLLPYTVPRLFTGTETNYFYVPPWIMLQDVVHGFGLGMTVDFGRWQIKLIDLGLAFLLIVGAAGFSRNRQVSAQLAPAGLPSTGSRQRQTVPATVGKAERLQKQHPGLTRSFILTYLLAAVLGLMLASLIKPMYMGARHIMIGSPAFFLLAARGFMMLPERPRQLPTLLAVLFLLTGPAISLHNLYFNPLYAKDDVRSLIGYIEQRAGSNDLVLYNNAVLMALHWHYQERPDLPVTALPVYPYAGGPDTLVQLEALAEQYGRIWYVTDPPADGRDKEGLVSGWLAQNAVRVAGQPAHGRTMTVETIAYQTGSRQVDALPADASSLAPGWPGLPALQGFRADFAQPAQLPTLWIELFWQGGQAPSPNQQLQFALRDPGGNQRLSSSHLLQPAGRAATGWPDRGLVRLNYSLPIPPGTPPGPYDLLLQGWDSAAGTAGEWQKLGVISLGSSAGWPVPAKPPLQVPGHIAFAGGMKLLGIATADESVRPGHPLPLSLYWQQGRDAPVSNLRYQLEVINDRSEVVRSQSDTVGPAWLSLAEWPVDAFMVQHTGLYFPPTTAPGLYRLRWRLLNGEETIPGRPSWRPWSSETIVYGSVRVEPWAKETTVPPDATAVQATFGPAISLYGYHLGEQPPTAGEALELTLYWQAQQVPDDNYQVFVHLLAGSDGQIAQQIDRIPVDWLRPTQGWRPGEVLTDRYRLLLPAELAPGAYDIVVGLYEPESRQRLPVTYQGESQRHDQLILTTIAVP
jgi:4-amino-4-deoxy-L-arabinose transferase-like glycosyltransferase